MVMNFRSFRHVVTAAALIGVVIAAQSLAEPKDNPAPGADIGENVTSPMRVQEMGELILFHTTITTSFEKMDVVGPIINELLKVVKEKHLDADAMVVFRYQGATADPTKEFELSIGVPVAAGTEAFDKWQVTPLPKFKAATVMHSGAPRSMGSAYQKIFPEIGQKGLTPTGENREFYMYWEGEDSVNNVMLVQVGVQ
jgi:effector-binding domain-containing protein